MFSRRDTLSLFLSLPAFLFFGRGGTLADIFFKPRRREAPRTVKNTFTDEGRSLVSLSGARPLRAAIEEAVSLVGGIERLDVRGKSVLVKPNVVSRKPNPSTTNPSVVEAVVSMLYDAGASRVYVGDMSALATLSTKRNMRLSGIEEAALRAGAETVAFEDFGWVEVPLKEARYIKTAYVTEWVYRVDRIVNLPVVKTHRSASYSITLKNFIGCTHLKQRPYLIDASLWEELVAEFNIAYSPELNIVDATVAMIEGGPWEGIPAKSGVIIASGDRVAADAVGLGLIKSFGRWPKVTEKDVWEQRQVVRALEAGIGGPRKAIKLIAGSGDADFKRLTQEIRVQTGL